jgi:hypothetical protein
MQHASVACVIKCSVACPCKKAGRFPFTSASTTTLLDDMAVPILSSPSTVVLVSRCKMGTGERKVDDDHVLLDRPHTQDLIDGYMLRNTQSTFRPLII